MTQPEPEYTLPDDDEGIPAEIPARKTPPPDDEELSARWILSNRHTAFGLGEFRKYANGIWPIVDKDIIRKEIKKVLSRARSEGIRPNNGMLSSVVEMARVEIAVPNEKWDSHPDFLPCKNGNLHIPTKTLLPHMPDIYATSQLPFDYDPAAECPAFMHALKQIPDAVDFLQEFAGYALTTDVSYELAIWLQGMPGTGKSTILTGLQAMLGERSGILGLAEIEMSRFALADLPGKTLVVSSEQPDGYLKASHIVNQLISGEQIRIEQKFKDAIIVKPHVKVIWAMNNLPRVNDANNGIMRRVKVIKFPPLADADRDPNLKEQIKTEGAGILNWALIGLERLRERKRFLIPPAVQGATDDFIHKNDIPKLFVEESGAKVDYNDPKCRTQSQFLYDSYSDWCRRNGHKPMSSTKMAEEWKRLGFDRIRIGGATYWTGIEISVYTTASNVP